MQSLHNILNNLAHTCETIDDQFFISVKKETGIFLAIIIFINTQTKALFSPPSMNQAHAVY